MKDMSVPIIEFTKKTNWETYRIGNLCDILTGFPFPGDKIKDDGTYLLMRGINITEGIVRHSDDIDRYYDGSTIGLEKYFLHEGDLVIGLDGSKVGKNSALVTAYESSSLLVQRVARLRNKDLDIIRLIQIAIKSSKFIKYIDEIKTSSAIPHISPEDIKSFRVSLPTASQIRSLVVLYFQSLDSLIQTTERKIASLKQIKEASLQAMFPAEGETVPKVRFKGFEGEWELVKFSNLYKKICEKNDLSYCADKIISVANMYFQNIDTQQANISNEEYMRSYNIMKLGDIAFEGNKSKNYSYGRFVENTIGDGIVSHVFTVFRPISQYDIFFWKYYINNENVMRNVLRRSTKASTMMNDLVINDFLKETIRIPSHKEQQRIGNYFISLDKQITIQKQRLEKLKQIKSACLDAMFV